MYMKNKRLTIITLLLFGFLCVWETASAQTPPTSTQAGVIEEKIGEETKAQERRMQKEVPPTEEILEDERPISVLKLEEKEVEKILIKKFILNGVTKFKVEDFTFYLSQYKDKELGIKELNEIASHIQNYYRERGYITSFVYVPVQKIQDNTVEIRVVEGCIGTIEVQGGKYFDPEYIREKLRVKEGDTVLYKDLIKKIRKLNTHPDLNVKAVLLPGLRPETTDIALQVTDRFPQHAFIEYDNRGTKYTGKQRFWVGYINNDLLGFEDVVSFRFIKSNEKTIGGSADYNIPVNLVGTRLGTYFSYIHADIVREFSVLNAYGDAFSGGVYLAHPFLDEDHLRGNLTFGLDLKRDDNYLLQTKISSDQLSIIKMAFGLNEDDAGGVTWMGNEAYFGIPDFLGSMGRNDTHASRAGAGGDFFKYKLSLRRQQNLPWSSFLVLSARSQYSPDKLVSGEEFYIGGMDTVRGYPELEYMGDYGYNVSAELRTPVF